MKTLPNITAPIDPQIKRLFGTPSSNGHMQLRPKRIEFQSIP